MQLCDAVKAYRAALSEAHAAAGLPRSLRTRIGELLREPVALDRRQPLPSDREDPYHAAKLEKPVEQL